MLYDFSCTPQVFSEKTLDSSESHFHFLVMFLQGILSNGMLADLNNGDWRKAVLQNINQLNTRHKDLISTLFKSIKDQNLIVGHPKASIKANTEDEWIDVADISNQKKPFFSIVSTDDITNKKSTLEEVLLSQHWMNDRSRNSYVQQDKTTMREQLGEILGYARIVRLIDPYFSMRKNYQITLNIVADLLRKQRGNRQKGTIEIHIKYEAGKTDSADFIREWERLSREIFREYGHICSLSQWEDINKQWHDRWIITDQVGVQVGAGLDIRSHGKSTWTKLEYNVLSDILKEYKENSSPFILKKTI